MNLLFYISALVAVISTFLVITRKSAVHALLYLVVSLLAVAIIFFSLGAPFVAALEVIIYAGAIMVLFVFVIMMLNLGAQAAKQEAEWLRPGTWTGPSFLCAVLAGELIYLFTAGRERLSAEADGDAETGRDRALRALCDRRRAGVHAALGRTDRRVPFGQAA